jgi:hypothetical protein
MYTLSSIKYRVMQNNLWYNEVVPNGTEKKDQPLALRVPVSLLETLGEIARAEDRPLGYVARELMGRGLALYRVDGKLRDDSPTSESKIVATIAPGSIEEARRLYEQNVEALTKSSAKAKKVPHLGEITDRNAEKKRKTG